MKCLLIPLFLLLGPALKAQWIPCVDSGRVNPMFQCNDAFYNPVCGCNNITYRNQCAAYNIHGVTNWRSGVCSGLDMDFLPNPVGPGSLLTINLSYPEFVYGSADLRIIDMYGKTWEQRLFSNFNNNTTQIDVSSMRTGIYIIVVRSSQNTAVVRKFSKY